MANKPEQWLSLEAGIASLQSPDESRAFLNAICSRNELTNLRHRWEAFQRVMQGANQVELRTTMGFGKITAGRCAEAFLTNRAIIETIASRAAGKQRDQKR